MKSSELSTVCRKVSASSLRVVSDLQQAVGILSALPGVKKAALTASRKQVKVDYDVAKLQYPALIHALEEAGLLKEPSWWERVKLGWYKDQDCVVRDNARAKPSPCCSNPTSILQQSGKKR
jgi:hypothetical protein